MLVVVAVVTSAYQTFNDHKNLNGVYGNSYWISAEAVDYATDINSSMASWNATATNISYVRTFNSSLSIMDIHQNTAGTSYWALTQMRVGSTSVVDPMTSN